AHRLLMSEFKLLSAAQEVSWDDVEAEVGFDQFIRSLEIIARGGGAVIPWGDAIRDPHKHLSRDAALAVTAINADGVIARPFIEDRAVDHVNAWLGGDNETGQVMQPRPLRLVLLGLNIAKLSRTAKG